jgi:16S rRNA C967 or C1407 C5-methylase (RsmB/RsmF family)
MSTNQYTRYQGIVGDYDAFLNAVQNPTTSCLWTNQVRTSPAELSQLMRELDIRLRPINWLSGAFRLETPEGTTPWPFLAGLYHTQVESDLISTILLEPRAGERILDLCAQAGDASIHIASLMGNRGTVVANDNSAYVSSIIQNIERLGLINVCITQSDPLALDEKIGAFDRVLVNIPSPEPDDYTQDGIPQEQRIHKVRKLLNKAIELCRPGGRIVFCNTGIAPEENEELIHELLHLETNQVRLIPAKLKNLESTEGIREWNGVPLDDSMRQTMRIWPHMSSTNGLFVAILQKSGMLEHSTFSWDDSFQVVEPDDASLAEYWEYLRTRFGVDYSILGKASLYFTKDNIPFCTPRDIRPPVHPVSVQIGQIFAQAVHKNGYPFIPGKLICGSAEKMRKNIVDLRFDQVDVFMHNNMLTLSHEQAKSCQSDGPVAVRYARHGLGFGFAQNVGQEQVSLKPL